SAVYRSRRGVERRLWQITIVLLVLFVIFSLASYILAVSPAHRARCAPADAPPRGLTREHHTELHDPNRHGRRRDPRRAAGAHRRADRRPGHPARGRPDGPIHLTGAP